MLGPLRINRAIRLGLGSPESLESLSHCPAPNGLSFFFSPAPPSRLLSFAFPLPPAGALHSRVYHCPDNNDLPTGEALREGPRVGARRGEGGEKRPDYPGEE